MSLNYDTRNVMSHLSEDEREKYFDDKWPFIEAAIFNTMSIGINSITEENYKEFYKRYCMYYQAMGWPRFYDLEFVKQMIGLKTNASSMTYPSFKKHIIESLEHEAGGIIRNETTQKEEN